ncbi:MAG: amino acid adenylation domain-containing protein [Firmicutes bacterium]|nr:amino acid adenylation domain-containing protein [Bacillota bacterium]
MSVVNFLSKLRELNIRVWIENNSLHYKAPQGIMTTELLDELKARRMELINFLKQVNAYSAIEPAPRQEYYPTSPAQKRFYILNQLEGAQTSYNLSGGALIEGMLDRERLAETFKKLVQRHEAFRTTFAFIDGALVQRIHPEAELIIDYQEVTDKEGKGLDCLVRDIIHQFIQPFDLSRAPLLRLKLLKVGPEKHILLYDMDHIISDGVSMGVLVRDFVRLYNGETLPELPIQYKDYTVWQSGLASNIIQQQEKFWLESFTGEIPKLNLPTDYPRPAVMNFQGAAFDITLSEALTGRLLRLAAQRKASLFMALLAGYNLLLARLTGAGAIIVGTPVSGRRLAGLENIIGMFLNTLALKNHPKPWQSFLEFLEEVKQNTLQVFENQDYPFETLLEKLNIPRDVSRNPLFDTLLNAVNENEMDINNYKFEAGGLKFSPYQFTKNTTAFDLQIYITEIRNQLHFHCEYRISLYKKATVEYLMNEFIRLLEQIVEDPEKRLQDYRVFHPGDICAHKRPARIAAPYQEFKAAAVGKSIVERFEEQVAQYPQRIAAKAGPKTLDYQTLNQRANQLARIILNDPEPLRPVAAPLEKPVAAPLEKPVAAPLEKPVALLFGNDPEMFTGIIGVLKAGRAYLPMDPTFPKERLAYMLDDSQSAILVSDHQNVTLANELSQMTDRHIRIIDISELDPKIPDDDLNLSIQPEQIAYIKYTSGSTGKPKGIPQTHRNILAFIRCYTNELHINPDDKVALFSSYSHSAGAIDIFSMLLNGGTLYPFDLKSEGNMRKVADWLIREGITIFHSVPMVYRYCTESLAEGERFSQVRLVVLGGEPVLAKDVERLRQYFDKNCVLVNMFGATEAIIGTFGVADCETEITGAQAPIGYPVEGVKIFLLNEANQEVPVFGVGEIIYESEYLALDYLNLPEKSAQAYGPNPLTGKGRVFRSGDLGRILPDGQLEFLGRKDFQVKIRGNRIELGEIEAVMDEIPGIHKSIVAGFEKGEGDYYLAAYYTVVGAVRLEKNELRRILGQKLPDYMIPSYFIQLEKLPLTPTGKVDRKALPKPDITGNDAKAAYEAPRNEIEARLAEIWRETLGVEKIGINDNFFDLGGHSLNATQVIAKIHKEFNVELPLREIFNAPVIKDLAGRIAGREGNIYSSIPAAEKRDYYPVSAAQKRMYIINQLDGNGISYNTPAAIIIEDDLDLKRLENVFRTLIARHEAFRTSFEIVNGEPVQRVHSQVDFQIEYSEFDGASGPPAAQEDSDPRLQSILRDFIRPFDLGKAPLLRVMLIKLSSKKWIMVYDTHHIITDGTSTGILAEEFISLYNGADLPELRIQYKDYTVWQNELLNTGKFKAQETYWLNRFKDEIPVLDLPADYPRPTFQSFEGDRLGFEIDPDLTGRLSRLAAANGATLYMVLLAVYNILLSKYSGQEDIIVGSSIAGRPHADLEQIIGVFINTLALRNFPAPVKTFTRFLAEVKENSLKAYENQDYPFERLVETLNLRRDLSRNPLFDVMFILQNMKGYQAGRSLLKFRPYELENKTAKFDLTLTAIEVDGKISNIFEYSTKLFARETIARFSASLIQIIQSILANPEIKIADIEVLSGPEKRRILEDFNRTRAGYPSGKLIHELFAEQAAKTPGEIALQFKHKSLAYRELNEQANCLARILRNQGVKKDCPVGIMLNRSLEMIIGIMAILKAGGAYLPIDPQYPRERIKYMLEDSETQVLLTQGELIPKVEFQGAILDLNNRGLFRGDGLELPKINTAQDLAYIIYTSGSTGQPKGVMIEHRAVHNFIQGISRRIDFAAGKAILALTTISFDIFGLETLLALARGLKVVIASEKEQLDPKYLSETIIQNRIEMLQITPSRLQLLLSDERYQSCLENVTEIMIGGEALPENLLHRVRKLTRAKIYNMYGPTETTIWSTVKDLTAADKVTIGTPIANTQIYILDPNRRPQPVGVTGELYIGGDGLARGYWKRPELTSEKFVPNPFLGGPDGLLHIETAPPQEGILETSLQTLPQRQRMYRTGDLARWLPDGDIEFLGRADQQVKIRGYRIELGEIENQLLKHEAIQEAVVTEVAAENGLKSLQAFYVAGREIRTDELRNHLEKALPDYMIPESFIRLDRIPKTPNGKVDRKALPKGGQHQAGPGVAYAPPQTTIENQLADIWRGLLKTDQVGIHDNFFALGGNSFLVVLMHNRIAELYPGKVDVADIFAYPTIARLAGFIETGEKAAAIVLEELVFPEEYFGASETDAELVFKFQISGARLAGIKSIAGRLEIELSDLLLATYLYLLAEISEQQTVVVQKILTDKDLALPIKIDFAAITDFSSLFRAVQQKCAAISTAAAYDIQSLNKTRIAKSGRGIIPFFASGYELTRKTLAHYDLLFNIKAITGAEVQFTCSYNQQRLRRKPVETMINAYQKLLDLIIKNLNSK